MNSLLDQAFLKLQQANQQRKIQTLDQRSKLLEDLERIILLNQKELLDALQKDLHRASIEIFLAEFYMVLNELRFARKHLKSWIKPKRVKSEFFHWPAKSYIQPIPKGIALVIGPSNYPFQLLMVPCISALAAGNSVIAKPTEFAPNLTQVLIKMIESSSLNDVFKIIEGDAEITQQLIDLKPDHVFFTGSGSVGKKIYAQAAAHMIPVTLELGSKNPCIIDDGISLEKAAERICWGKFFYGGQTCVAPNFLVVPKHLHDSWVEALTNTITKFYGADASRSSDFSRLGRSEHVERLIRLTPSNAIQFGKPDPQSFFFPPTIVPNSTWDATIVQEEIFGPMLSIIPYSSDQEVADQIKRMGQPLAMYLFSNRSSWTDFFQREVPAATIGINDILKQITNTELPFGGMGTSGMGNYRGKYGFDTFSHPQAVVKRGLTLDPFSLFPPYNSTKVTFSKRFFK